MKISVISPVKNEAPWIGYSIMAALPFVHEFIYGVADCEDGTLDLLKHIKRAYAGNKLKIDTDFGAEVELPQVFNFNPLDMRAYNRSFNQLIAQATGDAVFFLHPDMMITQWPEAGIKEGPLAWWTNVTSFAGDFQTKITKGRALRWKNIHAKKFGLHYFGGYGSQNEDFYHSDITGSAYKHYGTEFDKYPFEVADSGISLNHYCELKAYRRRLEKMKLCLKTQNPHFTDERIEELAVNHPRVTLESINRQFGAFEFSKTGESTPDVITKYEAEFSAFQPKGELVHG